MVLRAILAVGFSLVACAAAQAVPVHRVFKVVIDFKSEYPPTDFGGFSDLPLGSVAYLFVSYDTEDVVNDSFYGPIAVPASWGAIFPGGHAGSSVDHEDCPSGGCGFGLQIRDDGYGGYDGYDDFFISTANLTWSWYDQPGESLRGRILGVVPEPSAALVFGLGLIAVRRWGRT